jgi:hypothetical protein
MAIVPFNAGTTAPVSELALILLRNTTPGNLTIAQAERQGETIASADAEAVRQFRRARTKIRR